jgi:hypothetical protein
MVVVLVTLFIPAHATLQLSSAQLRPSAVATVSAWRNCVL